MFIVGNTPPPPLFIQLEFWALAIFCSCEEFSEFLRDPSLYDNFTRINRPEKSNSVTFYVNYETTARQKLREKILNGAINL